MNPLFHRSYRRKVPGKTSATAKAGVPWPIFAVAGYMLSRQPQDLYDLVTAQARAHPVPADSRRKRPNRADHFLPNSAPARSDRS